MRSFFILLFLIVFEVTHAQLRQASKEELSYFFKSTTYVVKDKNSFSKFNSHLEKAMDSLWFVTKFKIIDEVAFEKLKTNPRHSFIFLSEVALNEGMMLDSYNVLNLVLGAESGNVNDMPDIASVPLSYKSTFEDNYLYKIAGFINYMQYMARRRLKEDFSMESMYGICSNSLKSKKIWILNDEIEDSLADTIKLAMLYPYSIEFKTKEEIQEALFLKKKDIAYFHLIAPPYNDDEIVLKNCWKFIIACDTGELLYSDGHIVEQNVPGRLLKQDLVRITECQK